MNKFANVNRFVFALFFMVFSGFAAAAGGLDSATNALTNVKTWLFTFVGIGALVYMLYCILMAFMERKSWGGCWYGSWLLCSCRRCSSRRYVGAGIVPVITNAKKRGLFVSLRNSGANDE